MQYWSKETIQTLGLAQCKIKKNFSELRKEKEEIDEEESDFVRGRKLKEWWVKYNACSEMKYMLNKKISELHDLTFKRDKEWGFITAYNRKELKRKKNYEGRVKSKPFYRKRNFY